ncbi:hypothetical protein OG767_21980 [Micromonospora sp. NBC_01392]|uniref:hypothetical protein n=1 Tax=Micromonospora sp. NBC_01392 TaxID=2903588 RepID=UPI0032512135
MPPVPSKIKVWETCPDPTQEVFLSGAPVVSDSNSQQKRIILYGQDLQNIGYIDNRVSDATTSYEKSITTGFVFTTTQSISAEVFAEVDVEFAKVGLKFSVTLTFSEQWSKEVQETYNFSVGPGKQAFTYQGYIQSRVLIHDLSDNTYRWSGDVGVLYTPALVTRNTKID